MSYNVSEGAAYAVLYSVLAFFTILAIGSAGWFPCLPKWMTSCCMLTKDTEGSYMTSATDYFLAARNSAGVMALALSYFASGMGAWVLYGSTEMGATPQLSWLGVIGYSIASAFPAILIGYWLGPPIRNMTSKNKAFSTTDFGRQRYGRIMQVTIAVVSGFYMFIYIVAEMTSISNVFALLTNDFESLFSIGITIAIGLITILYTTIGGLPASIITDKFQGIMVMILVLILIFAISLEPSNQINREQFALASNWTVDGLMAAITLILAIAAAEMFNQANWQRVWAARSVPDMRKGFLLGSFFVFLLMMFFGVTGMIAYALDPVAYDTFEKYAFLAFFDLLEPLSNAWHIIVLILVTALAASSIDSIQNGLTSIFAHDLVKFGWNPTLVSRVLMVAINAPAVYLASKKFEVIPLFLVADLVCATSVMPVFLGLQTKDWKFLKAPTEIGAFLGCISGLVTVLINGLVNETPGGVFNYFWLNNGAICALCGSKTMVSFIITPVISAIMTYIFTYLDIMIRGERAREPTFKIEFDKEDRMEDEDKLENSDESGEVEKDKVESNDSKEVDVEAEAVVDEDYDAEELKA